MAEEPLLTIPYFHVCCARLNPQSQNQKWLSIATSKVCPISDPLPMPDQPFIPGQSDLVSTMSKNNLCAENGMGFCVWDPSKPQNSGQNLPHDYYTLNL